MELQKILIEFIQKSDSKHAINFHFCRSLQTGVFNWQEFAHIPYQELIEKAYLANDFSDKTIEKD